MKWIDCLKDEMKERGESYPDDIEKIVVNGIYSDGNDGIILDYLSAERAMNRDFDGGFGSICGNSFFAWSKNRVYFCHAYDGGESVESVPRNPCEEIPNHIGG